MAKALPLLAALVLLAGCGGQAPGGHDHGASSHGNNGGHDHGSEPTSEVLTRYGDRSELFVEFPPLVVNHGSRFTAHVTRLDDFSPVESGRMDVVLSDNGADVARFRVEAPARPGIFTPMVTPRRSGTFNLRIEVDSPTLNAVHELGSFRVFVSADEAAPISAEPAGEIQYLKEQQWQAPFASAPAREIPMRRSVPGVATVRAPADGGALITAPVDGYFTAADVPLAGQLADAGQVLGYLVARLGEGTDIGRLVTDQQRARIRSELSHRDVERLRGLVESGAVPERRLAEARAELEIARAELEAARERIEQRQGGSGGEAGIALKAPVAGELIDVAVTPGAFVRAGEPLIWLAAADRRWLEIRVPESHAKDLHRASGAWLESDGHWIRLDTGDDARLVQFSRRVDPESRTVAITLAYPLDDAIPRPQLIGATFMAHVHVGVPELRLAVPESAIIDDGGRPVVYIQTGGERFQRRAVETGIRDAGMIEIVHGVNAGERVVVTGAYDVKLASTGGDQLGHGHAH